MFWLLKEPFCVALKELIFLGHQCLQPSFRRSKLFTTTSISSLIFRYSSKASAMSGEVIIRGDVIDSSTMVTNHFRLSMLMNHLPDGWSRMLYCNRPLSNWVRKKQQRHARLGGQIFIFLFLFKGNCKLVLSASTLFFCFCKLRKWPIDVAMSGSEAVVESYYIVIVTSKSTTL